MPTSRPVAPSAATIAVAAGSSDTTRTAFCLLLTRADAVQQEAEQAEDHQGDDGRLGEAAQRVVQAQVIGEPIGAAFGAGDRRDHDPPDGAAREQAVRKQPAWAGPDLGRPARL